MVEIGNAFSPVIRIASNQTGITAAFISRTRNSGRHSRAAAHLAEAIIATAHDLKQLTKKEMEEGWCHPGPQH
jgi:hypothetical protein